MADICIIGGGVTGLTTAYRLMNDHTVMVLESQSKAGGWLQSYAHESGVTINEAPNGWLDSEPKVFELIQSLGLEHRLIKAAPNAKRWIWHCGEMQLVPTSPPQLLTSPLLSFWSKLRLLIEPFVSSRSPTDESLADFVGRRLGRGVLDTLVAPMCAGIFAAPPENLSAAAAFPLLIELEEKYGSLFKGMRARRQEGHSAPHLTSLKGGVGELSSALASQLNDRIELGQPALSVQPHQGNWRVHTEDGSIDADVVVLCCPAYVQSKLLRGSIPELSKLMAEIPYYHAVVAASVTERSQLMRPPNGFGILTARGSELSGALGVLYSSEIFPDYAPTGLTLTRCILGGARYPTIAQEDQQRIRQRVQTIHETLFDAQGTIDSIDIHTHQRAIPCYDPSHMTRQLAIRALQERHPGLYIGGNHIGGIGVKDCIRNAFVLAQQVHHYIYPPTVA